MEFITPPNHFGFQAKKIIVKKEEAVYINGQKLHTILNENNQELKMIGITIE